MKTAIPLLYHTVAESAQHMLCAVPVWEVLSNNFSMQHFIKNLIFWKIRLVCLFICAGRAYLRVK